MRDKNISVVIPVYNSEHTIGRCLEGIRKQTLPPIEVIVVDDGSKDRTIEIAKIESNVIPNTRRKGSGGARNTGAYAAKGDIITFIDSDCVPLEDWLEKIQAAFFDDTVVGVGSGYCSGVGNTFWQKFCFEELLFRRRNLKGKVKTLVSNNFACRKKIFLELGGFPEEYPVCEDMLLSYRMSLNGNVLWLNDNKVRHHFKDSLRSYLKHQYFFAAESTRFFLENPRFLTIKTHQGKSLYPASMSAFLSCMILLASLAAFFLQNFVLSRILFTLCGLLFLSHLLLYLGFILHLLNIKFPNIVKAYSVSFLRDLVCGLSAIDGIVRFLKIKTLSKKD